MRKVFLLSLLITFYNSNAQLWKVVTPFNNANVIRDMEATSTGKLYVIADQPVRMYKTDDGILWTPINNNAIIGNPRDLFMLDDNKGYLISDGGHLLKTTDGWQTSTSVNYGSSVSHNRVFFVNENVGFVAGYLRFMRMTLDGGQTWSSVTIPSTLMASGVYVTDIYFINDQIGFALTNTGAIIKTTDQGVSWTKIQLQSSAYALNKLLFVNDSIGFAVGALGEVYRTTDQGETWTLTNSGVGLAYDIRLHNGKVYLVGNSRAFTMSTDLGATWSPVQTISEPGGGTGILRMYAVTFRGNDILVAGEGGTIFMANNPAGTSWSLFHSPIFGGIATNDLQFSNDNQGVMVGAGNSQSAIYYTANGGFNWQRKAIGSSGYYRSIDIKSDGRGLVVGQSGFATTTNFGQNWSSLTSIQPASAYTKCWLKSNNDIFIGTNPGSPLSDGMIRRSGTTWSQFTNMYQIGDIKFADEQIGFAGTGTSNYVAKLWKTVDGGATWQTLDAYIGGTVAEIQIISPDKLYVRELGTNAWTYTQDGGLTWNNVNINFPTRFHFFDELHAYGIESNTQNVCKTEDGGQTWQLIIANDNSICGFQNFAWFHDRIVQAGGTFLVCVLNIETSLQVTQTKPADKKKIVIYPNPTKNIANISETAKTITLTDIAGKTLASYADVNQIDVSNCQKGIYFLSITTEDGFKQVLKILKE